MKVKKYRPFHFSCLEEHEQWLADMARQGWHYKGQDFVGFQHFEQGAPAELVFNWEQAPRVKLDASANRLKCREAGWELAASVGRWYCWSKPVALGQPLPSLRDKTGTVAILLKIQRHYAAQFMLMVALLFLNFPALFGKGRPQWHTFVAMAVMAFAAANYARGAFKAKARVRQLDAGA